MVIVQMGIVKYYTTRYFNRWQRKNHIADDVIVSAANEVVSGQYEASLGNNLFKKRISLNAGKRGGARIISALYLESAKLFVFLGYRKNEQGDMTSDQADRVKELSKIFSRLTDDDIKLFLDKGVLFELKRKGEANEK